MFTGIVECVGEIGSLRRREGLMEMTVNVPVSLSGARVGDSFCIQGACLTAVHLAERSVTVEVSGETLKRTTLGTFSPASRVNVERALRLSDPLGGHLVTGHVDGLGRLLRIERDGGNTSMQFHADPSVARYLVEKGSICIDGVSLTLGVCERETFWTYVIPHTMGRTTLQGLRAGARVNLEADIIGKYVEKFLANRGLAGSGEQGLSRSFLAKHGFTFS